MSIALLFPGQGSQVTGMGRDVAETSKEAMELWKKAERLSGLDLRSIYWESDDAALMADTRALQPALTVMTLTLWQAAAPLLEKEGLTPACAAGHSLGEYSALAAAGVLTADEALEIVTLRGALMAEADPSGRCGMAAIVKLPRATVEQAVAEAVRSMDDPHEVLLVANYNTPAQFVVSGTKTALDVLAPLIKERKGRMLPLAVSGAFHSPLMAEASRKLAERLNRAEWHTPRFPVYCNVTGTATADRHALQELAIRQMTSSVMWIDTIRHQWEDGVTRWLELGPKSVLAKMVRPILEDSGAPAEGLDDIAQSAGTLEAIDGLH